MLPFFGALCDPSSDLSNLDSFRASLKLGTLVPDVFRLSVNYADSLEQMIAAGKFDWKNDDITAKRFPLKGEGTIEVEARYFHFDRDIESDEAKRLIEEAGWEVAQIEHLLAHGKTFPEEQRKFPIVALGSVAEVDGYRSVPYLHRSGSRRYLRLSWWSNRWGRGCRFLAVRKVSAA